MKKFSIPLIIMIAFVTAAFCLHSPAHAQQPGGPQDGQGGGQQGGGEHHGPPPEAIAACKSLKMDQACSFTGQHGARTGTCWQPESSKPLACRPAHGGPSGGKGSGQSSNQGPAQGPANKVASNEGGGNQGAGERHIPPPESLAACKGLALNAACSFTSPRGAESGSCFQPDSSKPLACRPSRK
jgi:hypothetical protein